MSTTGWAQLRQQARSLETQTDNLFQSYSSFTSNPSKKPSDDEIRIESQLQDLLERRESTVASLHRTLDSDSSASSSATKLQNVLRHKEILSDHRKEYQRLKTAINQARNHSNLLSSVREDINQYRTSTNVDPTREADYRLEERDAIDRSHGMADRVLATAYAVNQEFGEQHLQLASINRRIKGAAMQIPGINTLIGKINTRKKRDSIIIAVLISFCFLMLLWIR
ncbi:hypothetical protein H072_5407 [Dactylellina haptotyla CBS 200.50]|uniref:Golgi SNAP receptor complex member 1 n=1 Tax=Dactylellina haptotyla (strain CBS 200.50) TaxID=1284197 RepID=S8BZC6_DACHA|nr:hypothetical protein H072_5407 [Dactylellina haptotyla CBS 200.50]